MKTSDGSFHQCYNGQAVVDEDHQVIVAAAITQCAADTQSLMPMLAAVTANCGMAPGELLANAGYCSDDNLTAIGATAVDAYIATSRQKHDEPPPLTPPGPIRRRRRKETA